MLSPYISHIDLLSIIVYLSVMAKPSKWNQDHYTKQAKKNNFKARSAFKLQEIDTKFNLFAPGRHILDLGCAPGSWLQYAASKCGKSSKLTGVDIKPCEIPNIEFIHGSIYHVQPDDFSMQYDIIMSDMAPSTTGSAFADTQQSLRLCEAAWNLACQLLKPGGVFLFKIFQSPDADEFITGLRPFFAKISRFKPQSTRQKSNEIYVICQKLRRLEDYCSS